MRNGVGEDGRERGWSMLSGRSTACRQPFQIVSLLSDAFNAYSSLDADIIRKSNRELHYA